MKIVVDYPGSKAGAGVWQRIISLMPVHEHYFEPFVGHGAVLLRKKPAPGCNVGSDVDGQVVEWWGQKGRTPRHVTIMQSCALRILTSQAAMRRRSTLVYLDPPYLRSVCSRNFYRHRFDSVADHERLLDVVEELQCMVMISGYDSELYHHRLRRPWWRHVSFNAMTRGGIKREFIWMNFPTPERLHDARFVGDGYRERERVKRKRDRPKNPCPRCQADNLKSANFCRGCGLMLQGHYTVGVWMESQMALLRNREKLGAMAGGDERLEAKTAKPKSSPAPPPMKLPATPAPPPRGR